MMAPLPLSFTAWIDLILLLSFHQYTTLILKLYNKNQGMHIFAIMFSRRCFDLLIQSYLDLEFACVVLKGDWTFFYWLLLANIWRFLEFATSFAFRLACIGSRVS